MALLGKQNKLLVYDDMNIYSFLLIKYYTYIKYNIV